MKKKVRNSTAWLLSSFLIWFGFVRKAKFKALNGDFILSVYFHAPGKDLFEFCVKWLIKNNFKFLSQDDVLAISQNRIAFPKGAVIITVDDGWKSNEENIVAIANKYKIPVTIFVSTEPIENGNYWWPYVKKANQMQISSHTIEELKNVQDTERKAILVDIKTTVQLEREALTVDQVKNIAKSKHVTIGGHTVNHPILPKCENEEAYQELKESKKIIETWVNKDITSFAYPNGDYGEREIQYLKELGYAVAYTTKPSQLTKKALKQIYELPRFAVFENVSNAEAVCRMVGVWQKFIN
ncbi:MAG TPA: polysaccharide deacetylase family protein [Mucilaginibacter sp.]|nr:polysaccharide deacetylase family protein [Mucilaginibacter sp.]